MELIFEIVSYHRLSPEQISKKSIRDSITLGRSENNDWHLPDPEKVVSGTHARVERQGDTYYIYDLSTNGLFINRSVDALGKDTPHKLMPDDLLTFGDYEVSVSFVDQDNSVVEAPVANSASKIDPFEEAFAPLEAKGMQSSAFADDIFAAELSKSEPIPAVSNNLDDYFEAPQAIPEEWEEDLFNINNTKPSPTLSLEPMIEPSRVSSIPERAAQKVTVHEEPMFQEPRHKEPVQQSHIQQVPKQASSQQVPRRQPAARPAAAPQARQATQAPQTTQKPAVNVAPAPRPEFNQPKQAPVAHSSMISTPTSGQLAFLEGLGVTPDIAQDVMSDALMHEMGECMKLMLLGLMESLRNRSTLKNEFRVNQTTFQQRENNPMKFSASIDDVFQNLFLRKSTSFLPANKAITEAFNDTRKHDIALSAGTLGEIKGILRQLDPNSIENKDTKESILDNVLPGNKQLRYWKIFKTLHADLNSDISSQGSSALSDDFVRAYDKKINSL